MRDWNTRKCARRGHVTYTPTGDGIETDLRGRLRTETALGEAWRCLRCGVFVLGEAKSSGPITDAPEVLRGKALRDHFILRLLAVERLLRGLLIYLVAWGVWKFGTNEQVLRPLFEKDITALNPIANHFGYDLSTTPVVNRIRHFFDLKPKTLHYAAIALIAYATLEAVEGIGLWLAKRWGEYLTVVGTSIFLPLEIWDGYSKFHEHKSVVLAACTFAVNVAAVVYLLVSKRLFGIRGGGAAMEAVKKAESLITIELAACGHIPPTREELAAAEEAAAQLASATEAAQSAEPEANAPETENSTSEAESKA